MVLFMLEEEGWSMSRSTGVWSKFETDAIWLQYNCPA